jgi:Ala-tRNA(Pro) deacylase
MELHETEFKSPARLSDGSPPETTQGLLERLAALDIAQRTVAHPPLFTVAESKALRGQLPGLHIKNLFLRNKKGTMWLVTCLEDREVDLKWLGEVLGAGRFSFGSAERLMDYLGVSPGAVTPFAVINDKAGLVAMVLDSALVTDEPVNAHPLVNDRTTAVTGRDLIRFLEASGHPPQLLDFER